MEIRDNLQWNSEQEWVKVEVTQEEETEEPTTVRLVLQKQVNLKIIGPVTGIEYHFPGAGSEVDVDALDVEGLLSKKTKACSSCSGAQNSPYFALVR